MLTVEQLSELRGTAPQPNRLQKAIELAGRTQAEIAAAVGVGQPHISDITKGNVKKLPLELAQRIAVLFGCTVEDLFPLTSEAQQEERRQEERRQNADRRVAEVTP